MNYMEQITLDARERFLAQSIEIQASMYANAIIMEYYEYLEAIAPILPMDNIEFKRLYEETLSGYKPIKR